MLIISTRVNLCPKIWGGTQERQGVPRTLLILSLVGYLLMDSRDLEVQDSIGIDYKQGKPRTSWGSISRRLRTSIRTGQ